jgi:hypothetical protein
MAKQVCANCGQSYAAHSMDTLRCPSPNPDGARWFPKIIADAITKAAPTFHESAKKWFQDILEQERGK